MRKMKLLLTGIFLASSIVSLASCDNGDVVGTIEGVDKNKTQLYVYNFDGGFGTKWLNEVKGRFETKYADYAGTDGKVGVQIIVENGKNDGGKLLEDISNNRNDIIFTENVSYYQYIAKKGMYDITDITTSPLTEYNENVSIFDKLSKEQQDYFKTNDGKVYAVPYRSNFEGIIYDIDLFNDNALYYAKGGCPSEYSAFTQANNANKAGGSFQAYLYTSLDGERSAGPDGLYGTKDDGLPATYEEFYNLCEYMKNSCGITPFIWHGKAETRPDYLYKLMEQFIADYEGLEGYNTYFTYNGTANNLVESIDANGNVVKKAPTTITQDNGYLMSHSAGRYYATTFMEKIITSKYYSSESFKANYTHLLAQEDYLKSKYEGNGAAFLVDGIWWENEADSTGIFKDMSNTEGAGRMERNFGILSLPKPTENEIGQVATYSDNLYSLGFINGSVKQEKVELAKAFLQLCFTEAENVAFNINTGCPRPMTYTMSEEDMAKLSPFGKEVYTIVQENPIVYAFANNDIYKEYSTRRFLRQGGYYNINMAGNLFDAFRSEAATNNSKDIFLSSRANSWDEFIYGLLK